MGEPKPSQAQQEGLVCPWPASIKKHFEKCEAKYTTIQHDRTVSLDDAAKESGLESDYFIRAVILGDEQGLVMAIMPANQLLDFSALCRILERDLEPVQGEALRKIFRDCEPGSYPPLPKVYELEAIIDDAVFEMPKVIFEPGIHEVLIEMTQSDFQKVHANIKNGKFSEAIGSLSASEKQTGDVANVVDKFTPTRMKNRTEETFELPSLPPIADEILKLRVDPDADAKKLGLIIEKDPSLSAQLISWARSPYYGYAGKVDSVECAIIKVLGFDLVMNLALGVVVGKAMRVPVDGPLGLRAYWQFSLFTAALVEKLIKEMPAEKRPPRGLAYLAGLLHNFGHLILGEVFPPQFFILNKYVMVNPHISITKIEQHVLGVRHEQIGAWLMQAWNMPKEIIAAVKWHHQGEFLDEHGVYANLVHVAIKLLRSISIGDAATDQIPEAILETLGLTQVQAQATLEDLMEHEDELRSLANQLSK